MFDVIFRMLADGDSAVPAAGMQAIPDQLAGRLPEGSIRARHHRPIGRAGSGRHRPGPDRHTDRRRGVRGSGGGEPARPPSRSDRSRSAPSTSRPDAPPTDEKLVVLDGRPRPGAQRRRDVNVAADLRAGRAPPGRRRAPGHRRGSISSATARATLADLVGLPRSTAGSTSRPTASRTVSPGRIRRSRRSSAVALDARPVRVRRPPRHSIDPGGPVFRAGGAPRRSSAHRARDLSPAI